MTTSTFSRYSYLSDNDKPHQNPSLRTQENKCFLSCPFRINMSQTWLFSSDYSCAAFEPLACGDLKVQLSVRIGLTPVYLRHLCGVKSVYGRAGQECAGRKVPMDVSDMFCSVFSHCSAV